MMSTLEDRNPKAKGLDALSALEVIRAMHDEDQQALDAVAASMEQIALLAQDAAATINAGGSVIYVGAGTSGRLGVLDASEIYPTFGGKGFKAVIAGGREAVTDAIEGAEDDTAAARIEAIRVVAEGDLVVGITASGTTPYVMAFMDEAMSVRSAKSWLVTCVERDYPSWLARVVVLDTGAELLSGSTRLKAGTATKLALNMVSTTAMVLLGGTYDGLMVDVVPTNQKLIARAQRIVSELAGVGMDEAQVALKAADMKPKTAVVMIRKGLSFQDSQGLLARCGGQLRKALLK